MLGEPFGTKLAAIDRVRFHRPHGDRAILAHPDLHPASHRAVSAGGRDPLAGNAQRGGVTGLRVARVGVFARKVVEPDPTPDVHRTTLRAAENAAPMSLGTTVT